MKLGILVNTDKFLPELVGLVTSADGKGHGVIIFAMDEGTRMLNDAACIGLADLANVNISFCDHSATDIGVLTDGLPEKIEKSSQYNNAAMLHNADKVIVL